MKTELVYTEKLNGGKVWKLFIIGSPMDPKMTTCVGLYSRPTKRMIRQYKRLHRAFSK
jgi:hypothetical protein